MARTPWTGKWMPLLLITTLSCLEEYDPEVDAKTFDILVVDGMINATAKTATVKLSYTKPVGDPGTPRIETRANVSIDVSDGSSIALTEKQPGLYIADQLVLHKDLLYTLRIKASTGKEFKSDTVRIYHTPAIDKVFTQLGNDGESLDVMVDTHDDQENTRYYTWDYIETYEYRAAFFSGFEFINHRPIERKPENQIYTCWLTVPSTRISVNTSITLSSDKITNHVLINIPKASPKISVRYSILVRQRSISHSEYEYLELLRKTSEELGGLYAPTPAVVTGNMSDVSDASALVLGFFSGSEISEQRLFLLYDELPEPLKVSLINTTCQLEETCDVRTSPGQFGPETCPRLENLSNTQIIISTKTDERGIPTAYYTTSPECGDCRVKGGTTQKPAFW